MVDNSGSELKAKIRQTEIAVTGVAEILENKTPPSLESMPIPLPASAEPIHNHPQNPHQDELENQAAVDELQGAWLASLDKKANDLNACLADITTALSELTQNVEHLEAETRMKNAKADGVVADNVMKKQMADRTYEFMVVWCVFIGSLITYFVVAYEGKPPTEFMLGLLGTCTISIIGLVGFVVSGLFKSPSKKEEK